MQPASSLFETYIRRPRSHWTTLGISLAILSLPFVAATLDGALTKLFEGNTWRISLLPPVVIIYILVVASTLGETETSVIEAFRPVVLLDDEAFSQLVSQSSRVNPIVEIIALLAGSAFGLLSVYAWGVGALTSWLTFYLYLSNAVLYALLVWTVVIALVGTRLSAALHRQALHIDIFDLTPFKPIGRQSLTLALIFVGGITLSLLLTVQSQNIRSWDFWLIYGLMALVPLLIFFLNMRPTHRVLAAEKNRQIEAVQGHLQNKYRALVGRLEDHETTGDLPAEIAALVAYERHLQNARTWPYNTTMLRTLFFSVLVPGATLLGRLAIEILRS